MKKKIRTGILMELVGIVLLAAVVVISLPIIIPKMMGLQIYAVTGDGLEPEISAGSLIYLSPGDSESLSEGDLAAYYSPEGGVAIQHVLINDPDSSELSVGSSNEEALALDYASLLGKVEKCIPRLGWTMRFISSTAGLAGIAVYVCLAIVLVVFGIRIRRRET